MGGPQYLFHVDPPSVADAAQDEMKIQVQFRNRMRTKAPGVMLVAIPNAGRRSSWEGLARWREGMVPGFPDMMALWDGRVAFLEFKAGSGTIDPKQIDCLNRLMRQNFVVGVFRSADTAVEWLRGHGAPFA